MIKKPTASSQKFFLDVDVMNDLIDTAVVFQYEEI